MKTLVIAVTGLNAIDSPGPGVAVIRAIRECSDFDVRIIGLSYEALEPGIYLHDLVDKSYQLPLTSVLQFTYESTQKHSYQRRRVYFQPVYGRFVLDKWHRC